MRTQRIELLKAVYDGVYLQSSALFGGIPGKRANEVSPQWCRFYIVAYWFMIISSLVAGYHRFGRPEDLGFCCYRLPCFAMSERRLPYGDSKNVFHSWNVEHTFVTQVL
jgi:hypothetical protein